MYEFMIDTFLPSLKMVFAWIQEMFVSFSNKIQEGNTVSVVFMFSIFGTIISGLAYILMNFIEHSINTDYSEPFIPFFKNTRKNFLKNLLIQSKKQTDLLQEIKEDNKKVKRFYSGNDKYSIVVGSDDEIKVPENSRFFNRIFRKNKKRYVVESEVGRWIVPDDSSVFSKIYKLFLAKFRGFNYKK